MYSLQGIGKSFGGIDVLTDICLTLRPGQRLGITGANGVGKSTLINIATGFLTPDSGHIHISTCLGLRSRRYSENFSNYSFFNNSQSGRTITVRGPGS
jgi:ABC-type sugar transport system ATPase subunit